MGTLADLPPPTHDSVRAKAERLLHPSFSWCGRCGRPWCCVKAHTTDYSLGHGMFPLCVGCWTELGHPEARIPYYAAHVERREAAGYPLTPEERLGITRAVAGGR